MATQTENLLTIRSTPLIQFVKVTVKALLWLAFAIFLFECRKPCDKCSMSSWNQWAPHAGYVWVDRQNILKGVQWSPGLEHNKIRHVLAAPEEDNWKPEAGYTWVDEKDVANLLVVWQVGAAHPVQAHLFADSTEGNWMPEAGYQLREPDDSVAAVWSLGAPHPDFSHVVAARTEGTWQTQPGFRFAVEGKLSNGIWTPGLAHPRAAHVIADARENTWKAASGYVMINSDPNILSVALASRDNGDAAATRVGEFLMKLAGALILHSVSTPQQDDGFLASNVGRPIAGKIADELGKDAVGIIME